MSSNLEATACTPYPVDPDGFNSDVQLPYGCTICHVFQAMTDFTDFLGFVNRQLHTKDIPRLESFLMPANFSSMVGEFMVMNIPKYCSGVVKNQYHNGHPDLIPAGRFPDDSIQYASEGIEIKASRHTSGWQGHNPEDTWLMVFVFDSNTSSDISNGIEPKPFRFIRVIGDRLTRDDWSFSGRSGTSRRTITASVRRSGYDKMMANWIYESHDSK